MLLGACIRQLVEISGGGQPQIRLILPLKTPSTSKSITRPAFTPANKIRAQINVGAKLAGHYCAAARPYRLEYVPIIIRKWYDIRTDHRRQTRFHQPCHAGVGGMAFLN
jgi:hypothetical protein